MMTIENAQKQVDHWIKTIGVRYFSELTNMALLTEEVGELARIIARKYGDQSYKESETKLDLADEMADVFFVLICLANQTGVDLSEAFTKNLEKKTSRDSNRPRLNEKLK
jgi:NTP pyrophosphatase (non-canonical NTP hydrolase)